MKMKKIPLVFMFLVFLTALPSVHAQGFYVSGYNATYYFNTDDYLVEETIMFKNSEDPFNFEKYISFIRGDARDVEVYVSTSGARHEIDYDYPTRISIDLKDVVLLKEMEVTLSYRRSEGLSEENYITTFKFLDLGRYPWSTIRRCIAYLEDCKYEVNIKLISPENYQFGEVIPTSEKIQEENHEVISYTLSLLENLSVIETGFPVEIEYAKFKDLAIEEIAVADTLVEEATYDVKDANTTIENAKRYGCNLTTALALYGQSLDSLKESRTQLQLAKALLYDTSYRQFYLAYTYATGAKDNARKASRKASEAKNNANFEIQHALENKIAGLGSTLAQQSQALMEDLTQKIRDLEKEKEAEKGKATRFKLFIVGFLIIFCVGIVIGTVNFLKKERVKERGSVKDFSVIDDLKRKTFKGFEQKVETVKRGVEIAAQIRDLKQSKEKFWLGIENLRKKKIANEISEVVFEVEKHKLEEGIKELDKKIETLETELKEIRQVKK